MAADDWVNVDDKIRVRVDRKWVPGVVVAESRVTHPRAVEHDEETGQPVYDKNGRTTEEPTAWDDDGNVTAVGVTYLDLLYSEERIDETADAELENGDRVLLVRGAAKPRWEKVA